MRVTVDGEDELAALQQTFNQMASGLQQTTADLQAERDKLADLLRSQRELTAGISHELRTPLAAASGYLESALQSGDETTPTHHSLGVAREQMERMDRILNDLLTLARTQASALSVDLKAVDAGATIHRVTGTLGPLAWQQKKVEASAQVPNGLPPVLVDEGRLEQVLNNLVQNAIRHSVPGGIVVVQAETAGERVWIDRPLRG